MGELSDLERRIEHLRRCASSGPPSPELVAEIESVLSEGYVCALRADARSYRLREQVDARVEDFGTPSTAEHGRCFGLPANGGRSRTPRAGCGSASRS